MQNMRSIVPFLIILAIAAACSGRGNVDLSKATPLTAEPVKTPPKGSDATQMNPLFSYAPGTWVSMKAVGGVIDPVGTSLELDFDGDGIDNSKEKTSNIWVADYPVIDTQIAPPVTMNVEILKTTNGEVSTINTNLTSDNFESKKNEGSEEFHQNETNLKTINNGSTTSGSSNTIGSSSSKTSKQSTSVGVSLGPVSINDATADGITNSSFSADTKFNTTTTQLYEDRPFKNNIDRTATSVKSEDAAKKARDYRAEKRLRQVDSFATKSDGGIVRAALYIKNHSVNMPVKLSNILCSLVFETPAGALIPIQSFRLRNDDYSLFEVEVYGSSEFGPYVVTLSGLNTAEIENAIQLGYTPKIYIVDYKMTHVQDSGYRMALGINFSGDNLKIIEENAKGRTALLKLMYPNYREMFRITAFDTKFVLGGSDICKAADIDTTSNTSVSPGIPMHKFLERLKCSGIDIKFDHYVFDFTGMPQAGIYPQFYVFAVKSVNNKSVTAPCTSMMPGVGYNPVNGNYDLTVNACVIKIVDLTEEQLDSFGVWGISNNGRYYNPGDFARDGNDNIRTFNGVPILKGVTATVWAGDNYDLVQLRLSDILAGLSKFGKNPLETGNAMPFNTKWDLSQLGNNPFDPEVKSIYLGKAGLGETVELTFNLKDTTFLNPDFGPDVDVSSNLTFSQFSYNIQKTSKKFNITEAIDFELSMGMGGSIGDWQNILRPPTGANNISLGPVAVDYLNQKFTVMVKLPDSHPLAQVSGTVNLFLRPALSNAYRTSIWPQDYAKVKKYDATLNAAIPAGSTVIPVKTGIGSITDIATGTDLLKIVTDGVVYSYPIAAGAIPTALYGYDVSITSAVSVAHKAGDRVYVDAGLNQPQVIFFMDYKDASNNFLKAWNDAYPTKKLLENNNTIDCLGSNGLNFNDMKCLGYAGDYIVADWLGNQVLENNWTDWTVFSGNNKEMRVPFTLAQSSEKSLGILPGDLVSRDFISGAEIPLSSTQGIQQGGIQIGLSKKRALVVWSSRITLGGISTIRGRLYDLASNTPIGGSDFPISTSNNAHNELPSIAISGDRAIVVWRNLAGGTAVRGRFVDLSLGAVMGSGDFQISTSIPQNLFHRFLVRSNGIYALVVWPSDPTGNVNIRGRKIDMVNSTLLGSGDFPITTGSGSGRAAPILEISGNYAVIAWEANARILNLSNPDPVESDPVQILSLSTTAGTQPSSTQVAVSGRKAIIAWMDRPNLTSNYSIFGRIVDVDTGTIHGLTDLLLSTTPSEDVAGPTVGSWGDYALIAWSAKRSGFSNYDLIKARVVDLANQSMQGLGAFQVNAQLQPYTAQAKVSMDGPYAVIGWTSPRVFGRVIDIANGMPLGSGDIYLDDGTLQIGFLNDLKITGDVAFASWWSSDANGIDFIRGSVVKLNAPLLYGSNNFFTAPLIERNYTVTSKIKF